MPASDRSLVVRARTGDAAAFAVLLRRHRPRLARLCYLQSPVGVVLRRSDGPQFVARRGRSSVTVTGSPEELAMHAYGRAEAMVTFEGDQLDIQRLQDSLRGF